MVLETVRFGETFHQTKLVFFFFKPMTKNSQMISEIKFNLIPFYLWNNNDMHPWYMAYKFRKHFDLHYLFQTKPGHAVKHSALTLTPQTPPPASTSWKESNTHTHTSLLLIP